MSNANFNLNFNTDPTFHASTSTQIRRTKIIATLGPASNHPDMLKKMILAGADIFRLNFSHGFSADHEALVNNVRAVAKACNREVSILADLQGPKIRISKFIDGKITLKTGDIFILDATLEACSGNQQQIGIDYKALPKEVHKGDFLLLDDGRLVFEVLLTDLSKITCRVITGGVLSDNKGINKQGGGLSAKALTVKDKTDLKTAVKLGADYIAISFPRTAEDIINARALVTAAGGSAGIIAKIERTEAIHAIDEIIKASDAIMVARGDLGVEIGEAELPAVQKMIIHRCRSLNKVVITATQMMESMIYHTIPTRAEVFDVANAVLDGTDAVMLSAETATGHHPDIVIQAMARACLGAEKNRLTQISRHRVDCQFERVDEAIAMATMYTANHFNIKAIVALTESGATPLWMSRIRSGIPIYALTRHKSIQRKMILYRGVYPVDFVYHENEQGHSVNERAVKKLVAQGIVNTGDFIIVTCGDQTGQHGNTNTMKIIRIS